MPVENPSNWVMVDLEVLKDLNTKLCTMLHNQTAAIDYLNKWSAEVNKKLQEILEKR